MGKGRGVLPAQVAVAALGDIARHPRLLSMEQLRQRLAIVHIRLRGGHGMKQFRLAVDPNIGLHAEVLLIALLGLMHLRIRILILRPILGRTGGTDDGGIHDGPRLTFSPCAVRYAPIRAKSCWPNWWASKRCGNLQIVIP